MEEFRKRVIRCRRSARSSVGMPGWQSALAALLLAAPAQAGPIQTLPLGIYYCELPGDAVRGTGIHVPSEDFAITHSSSYAADGQVGSYLMSRGIMEMTSGPHQGEKFHLISPNFLRKLNADGTDSELRCVRSFTNSRG